MKLYNSIVCTFVKVYIIHNVATTQQETCLLNRCIIRKHCKRNHKHIRKQNKTAHSAYSVIRLKLITSK